MTGEPFIAKLEQGIAEGKPDYIEANMHALEKLIGQYQQRAFEIAQLAQRARIIREQHEPSAETRIGR